jgi:DNA-binding MarR family transcriptional regulator
VGSERKSVERGEVRGAIYALSRSARMFENRLVEMTLPQLRVLRLVADAPGRASALAERAAVSRPSLTGVIDGLEARGWLRRAEVDGDRRGVNLEVTDAGRGALAAEEAALGAHLEAVLATVTGEERRQVLDALGLLSVAQERWREAKVQHEAAATARPADQPVAGR